MKVKVLDDMTREITIERDDESYSLGMWSFIVNLKQSKHTLEIKYISEPPHGDSIHEVKIDGKKMQGYVWGCDFTFPFSQRCMI